MTDDWKKILLEEEKNFQKIKMEREKEKLLLDEKVLNLIESLPEIKNKINQLNKYFSSYKIKIEEPIFNNRKDSYAEIYWVCKFDEGNTHFLCTFFRKNLKGFSYHFSNKLYYPQNWQEPDFENMNQFTDRGALDTHVFKSFDEMWEKFILVHSKEIVTYKI